MDDFEFRSTSLLDKAKQQLGELKRRDYGTRQMLKQTGMTNALEVLEDINPSHVYDHIEQLIDRATGMVVPKPTAQEANEATTLYRNLSIQLSEFKDAVDRELLDKGVERKRFTDQMIGEGGSVTERKDAQKPDEAWLKTPLGQAMEQSYALVSETVQHSGLMKRALDKMKPPPEHGAGGDIISFSA